MSDTPETDFKEMLASEFNADTWVVSASFSRQLERELAEANRMVDGAERKLKAQSELIGGALKLLRDNGIQVGSQELIKAAGEAADKTGGAK